jgi:hypothetical protein
MKKYKIFVSANQKELRDERYGVKEIIINNLALREVFDVFLFEDLPAKGKSPTSTYLKQVDESDIYIGIIGSDYGIKGRDNLSATEREFRRSIRPGPRREILIFVKGRKDSNRDKDTQRFMSTIKA